LQLLRELEFDDIIIAVIQVKALKLATYLKEFTLHTCINMTKTAVFIIIIIIKSERHDNVIV